MQAGQHGTETPRGVVYVAEIVAHNRGVYVLKIEGAVKARVLAAEQQLAHAGILLLQKAAAQLFKHLIGQPAPALVPERSVEGQDKGAAAVLREAQAAAVQHGLRIRAGVAQYDVLHEDVPLHAAHVLEAVRHAVHLVLALAVEPYARGHALERGVEFLRIDGLEQIVGDVDLQRVARIAEAVVAAYDDKARRQAQLPRPVGQLYAAVNRHAYVGEHDVRPGFNHEVQRVAPVVRRADKREAQSLPLDEPDNEPADIHLVVAYHDF